MKNIRLFPFITLAVYLVGGFIILDFDLTNWTPEGRFFLVWTSVMVTLMAMLASNLE